MSRHIRCPSFAAPHAFFSRNGGVSKGVYASLNCGPGSKDEPTNVAVNRCLAASYISGDKNTPLLTCYQIHSATIVVATNDWDNNRPKADAVVTNTPGLILGILTADCTPVLFIDDEAGVIGAAHAGWKGALTGVLENTLAEMEKLGAVRSKIRTAIGPTIHPDSYEVQSDFRAHFADSDSSYASFFSRGKDVEHYQFDLPAFVKMQLKTHGVDHIWDAKIDTYQSDDHFSYRRSTHKKEADYGRQLSAIMLPISY